MLCFMSNHFHQHKKNPSPLGTTMLANSKNVLFPGHSQLLTTVTDAPSFAGARAMITVSAHQH